nr:hypothetical protein [Tanacetum cinerariifolium]
LKLGLGALTGEVTGSMIGELNGSKVKIGDLDWITRGWTSSVLSLLVGCTVSFVASGLFSITIGKKSQRWNLRSIIRHTTLSSDCFQITSRVSNGVARKSTRARSRGIVGVHKLGEQIGQISQFILNVFTLSLYISHNHIISLNEREENPEVKFDLTSSEDESWSNAFTISLSLATSGEIPEAFYE